MLSLSDHLPPVRPREIESPRDPDWRRDLRQAFRDPHELVEHLGLPAGLADSAAERGFSLLAPRPFVDRMRAGDPADPLLRQVLPHADEASDAPAPLDAVGDLPAVRAPGLIQKYHGRALLTVAGGCAVNCRYCFRRHFPYDTVPHGDAAWEPALRVLAEDPSVTEVLLSGGDPLLLGDDRLARLVERLEAVPHLRTLRIHTRLPVVIPARITERLAQLLDATRFTSVVVLHTNHANEIDAAVADAAGRLRRAGAMLLNQSVLLRGVNDSVESLAALSERLVEIGVTPYYLHQLDVVAGVRHFETPLERGLELVQGLRERLPGYAVPRFVQERPGEPHKTPLA